MAKLFGVLSIIAGLGGLGLGAYSYTELQRLQSLRGIRDGISGGYGRMQDLEQLQSIGLIAGGALLLLGIILVSMGGKSQKIEIHSTPAPQQEPIIAPTPTTASVDPGTSHQTSIPEDKYKKLERLSDLKDKGILSEDEFIEEKRKVLDSE